MSAFTDYLEEKLLDHILRNVVYTPPATVYLALFTSPTTDAGGGTEVTGGSYVRKAIAFGPMVTPGQRQNSATIEYTNMPAVTITHAALCDALTAGNKLVHGPLTTPQVVVGGTSLRFPINEIRATLN